jgi:LmbE family N-acetylglucosaminyl deacetylase
LIIFLFIDSKQLIKILFSNISSNENVTFIREEKHKKTRKYFLNHERKIKKLKYPDNKKSKKEKVYLIKEFNRKECLATFSKKMNSTFCLSDPENDKYEKIIRIDINDTYQLCDKNILSRHCLLYKSNNPNIVYVNNKGIIKAIRPGKAIITIKGFNNIKKKIKVISIPSKGLISNNTLIMNNATLFKNLMIVAHPDDETLWGGANLYKDKYFVVCITNGYNFARARDFRKILNFTKNRGLILDYPDLQDSIRDNWSEVQNGLLKDLSTIISYNQWDKIVTHGPDGTTGHIHHKMLCNYVTNITKKFNLYNNLYYFGKFYKINEVPKNLNKISDKELEYKQKEVSLYKSVNWIIHKFWYHMLPYENWILASEWRNMQKKFI